MEVKTKYFKPPLPEKGFILSGFNVQSSVQIAIEYSNIVVPRSIFYPDRISYFNPERKIITNPN